MITIGLDPGAGRWSSVDDGRREWLWQHPDPAVQSARGAATAGAAFVDAGGVEECFPTVRGEPDHGAAWAARWTRVAGADTVSSAPTRGRTDQCRIGDTVLRRAIDPGDPVTRIDYRVDGPAGFRFVHAVHALLELSDAARISIDGRPAMRVLDHDHVQSALWPDLDGVDVSYLTPIDRTAYAMIIDCSAVRVIDGRHSLRLAWRVTEGSAPTSLLYWRNLHGWPQSGPYRSIGIEPLIGRTAEPDAEPEAAARLGPSGRLRWQLDLSTA